MTRDRPTIDPATTSPGGVTVIVVDDDDGLRAALLRVLAAAGFDARAYASAEDLLAAGGPDGAACLVVDLDLPAMSGLDLVERLRRRGITVPALVISAHDERRVRVAARCHGIERCLTKPFAGSALVQAVRDVVARRC